MNAEKLKPAMKAIRTVLTLGANPGERKENKITEEQRVQLDAGWTALREIPGDQVLKVILAGRGTFMGLIERF